MSATRRKPPVLLKLTFGSIEGWWSCLGCGWSFPGRLNPCRHQCHPTPKPKRGKR